MLSKSIRIRELCAQDAAEILPYRIFLAQVLAENGEHARARHELCHTSEEVLVYNAHRGRQEALRALAEYAALLEKVHDYKRA
jgi:hypothetical protein